MFPTSALCTLVLSLFPIFWVEWMAQTREDAQRPGCCFCGTAVLPTMSPGVFLTCVLWSIALSWASLHSAQGLEAFRGGGPLESKTAFIHVLSPRVYSAQCRALRRTHRRGDMDVSPETSAPSEGGSGFWGTYCWSSLFFAAWRVLLFFLPWVHRHPSWLSLLCSQCSISENRYMTEEWVNACYDTVLYWGLALTRKRTDHCSIHCSKSI